MAHRRNIMKKLDLHSAAELVKYALKIILLKFIVNLKPQPCYKKNAVKAISIFSFFLNYLITFIVHGQRHKTPYLAKLFN